MATEDLIGELLYRVGETMKGVPKHPMHEGRSIKQIGRQGKSNHRWIVEAKLCPLLHHRKFIVGWGHFLSELLIGRLKSIQYQLHVRQARWWPAKIVPVKPSNRICACNCKRGFTSLRYCSNKA